MKIFSFFGSRKDEGGRRTDEGKRSRPARYKETVAISRRSVILAPLALAFIYILLFGVSAFAYVRLSSGSGNLFWSQADSRAIDFTISSAGSDNIPDRSEEEAIRMAFETWNAVPNTFIRFVEDASKSGRRDWESADLHLVFFDENNATSFFNANSGIVAVTPVSFVGSGLISDADIIFNGFPHNNNFSTNGQPRTFDVQNIVMHEIGHFLGLDHSGVVGSTMYPYALHNEIHQRSPQFDDMVGVTASYPALGAGLGTIQGRVVRSNGGPVSGAHVVAVNMDGDCSAALSGGDGSFVMGSLPPGSYILYAEPLDGPVETANLYSRQVETNFSTAFWTGGGDTRGEPSYVQVVSNGVTTLPAALVVGPSGELNIGSMNPARVTIANTTITVNVGGSGFSPSCTAKILGGGAIVQSARFVGSGSATLSVLLSGNAEPGLRTLVIRNGLGEPVCLSGGLELQRPAPSINDIVPSSGDQAGGTRFTVQGSEFQSGARVTVGGALATETVWVGPYRIDTTAPANSLGPKDVIVINPDGQYAIYRSGFNYVAELTLNRIDPNQGPTVGSQTITLGGGNFPGSVDVFIGDKQVPDSDVTVLSSTAIRVNTPPGLPGSVNVKVVSRTGSGDSSTLNNAYSYVLPSISKVFPNAGSVSGGTPVRITGAGFGKGITVRFGSRQTTAVTLKGHDEVEVVSPAGEPGDVTIQLSNTDGRGVVSEERYRYVNSAEPRITRISPPLGPIVGGTLLSVNGSNFDPRATLWVGGVQVRNAVVETGDSISGLTPSRNSPGIVEVWVKNPNGLTAVARNGFEYRISAATQAPVVKIVAKKSGGLCSHAGPDDRGNVAWTWMISALAAAFGLSFRRRKAISHA